MAKDNPSSRDDGSLQFFGAITASVSHDLTNVLSTIDQISGLLEDMLFAAQRGNGIDPDRLDLIRERLTRQTGRGLTVVQKLNTLGHTTDEPLKQIDVRSILETLSVLMERMAARRRTTVDLILGGGETETVTDPFALSHLLYLALLLAMDSWEEGGEVTAVLEGLEDGIRVEIQAGPLSGLVQTGEMIARMNAIAAEIDAAVSAPCDSGDTIEIVLPRRIAEAQK